MKVNWIYFWWMMIFGIVAVLGQVYFADKDDFLTVRQIKGRKLKKALPLLYHGGIWGDVFPLTPLLACLAAFYGDQWDAEEIIGALLIGFVALLVMGTMWVFMAKNGTPEAHTHDGKMTAAGLIHAIYFIVAIAVIKLAYFNTAISQEAAIWSALLLGIHVVYGTHVILGIVAEKRKIDWYPDRPQKNPVTWITILVCWGLLAWRCITI